MQNKPLHKDRVSICNVEKHTVLLGFPPEFVFNHWNVLREEERSRATLTRFLQGPILESIGARWMVDSFKQGVAIYSNNSLRQILGMLDPTIKDGYMPEFDFLEKLGDSRDSKYVQGMFDFNSFDLHMDNGGKYAAYSSNSIPRHQQMRVKHSNGVIAYWHHMLSCATTNLNPQPHVKTLPHEVLLFCTAPTMPKNDNEVDSSNQSAASGRSTLAASPLPSSAIRSSP